MSSIDFSKIHQEPNMSSVTFDIGYGSMSTSNCMGSPGPIGPVGIGIGGWYPGTTTVPMHVPTYSYSWPENTEMTEIKKDLKELKKMMGLILEGDENPELLEKYKNLKKAYEEYKFFRDLILNNEEKKESDI